MTTNIFEVRAQAAKESREVSAVTALNFVFRRLDRMQPDDEVLEAGVGVYQDQDSHYHLVLKSERYNEEQLDKVYNSTYLTGSTCAKRSVKYWQSPEARMKVIVDGKECEVDAITVASVLQEEWYRPNDMVLMSGVLAWLDGDM
jgi:hypothetical protein